jgi:hypothetical protein
VPVAQCIADINAVLDAGGKFFRFRQIDTENSSSTIRHVGPKILNPFILRRPAALRKRIPTHLPFFA